MVRYRSSVGKCKRAYTDDMILSRNRDNGQSVIYLCTIRSVCCFCMITLGSQSSCGAISIIIGWGTSAIRYACAPVPIIALLGASDGGTTTTI